MLLKLLSMNIQRVIMTTIDELKEIANQDATTSAYRVTVLYGDFGKRKTTTACSMVDEKGLLLSSDDSWKVLLNERHRTLSSKFKIVKLQGLSQLQYIDFSGYDTIIWDTISKSVDRYLDLLYDEADWGGKFREKLSTKNPDLKNVDILAPTDYRVTRDIFRPTLDRLFNNTEAHIIFTSQVKEPIKGLSPDMVKRPDVPPATFKIIAERADLIVNLRPENRGFVADLTENSLTILAKSRIEGLQGKMNLDDFVTKYKEIVFK